MAKYQYPKLIHPYETFSKGNIKETAKQYGLLEKKNIELHMWVYEIYAQIQKIARERCVLKGGAATQLHLPLSSQRCTVDLDCATSLTPKEVVKALSAMKSSLQRSNLYVNFREYIPKKVMIEGRTLPIRTFILDMPLYFSSGKGQYFSGLKMDFLLVDMKKMHKTRIMKGKSLGINLNYKPWVIDKFSTISDKLITLATSTMGLERRNLVGIYKNIYDVYSLITSSHDLESFKTVSERLKDSLAFEIEMKKAEEASMEELLEDILSSLYRMLMIDIRFEFKALPYPVTAFVEEHLQVGIREQLDLDMWANMASFLYIWVSALKEYIQQGTYLKLEFLNSIVEEYEYYQELTAKSRYKIRADLRKEIKEKENTIFIQDVKHPLRLIYLKYILSL